MTIATLVSALAALLIFPFAAYLGLLAVLAWAPKPIAPRARSLRFKIVVPAHDEELSIKGTVESLLSLDWPRHLYEVVVVADNCTDQTAEVARKAGARVLERVDATRRGKGYALEHAFEKILEEGGTDAIVVVDADTIASANILQSFAARIERGALACQAEYGVSNVDASWRTRMMTLALAMFHRLRSLARERMKVSSGLRGNGMCFTTELLRRFPHKAYGLVEDVEYGIQIGLGGVRVHYAWDAFVLGEMVTTAGAAASQRRRWEGGRSKLVKERLPELFKKALRRNDGMLLDLALDLAVPPLSTVGAVVAFGFAVEAATTWATGALSPALPLWGMSVLCLTLYLLRGIQLSGLGARAVLVLGWAPIYVAWKLLLVLPLWRRGKRGEWVRTKREKEAAS